MGFLNDLIKDVIGGEDNFTKLIRAADNGEQWAKEQLNAMWQRNEPNLFEKIANARQRIYAEGAKNGEPKSMYYYGISSSDSKTFMKMLLPLAEKGNIDAIKSLAGEYGGLGNRVPQNSEESFKWYLKAAELGDVFSQNQVALAYTCANGCGEINYDKAFEWYSKAAKQNSAKGYCGMGKCYEEWQRGLWLGGNKPTFDELLEYDQKRIDCYEMSRDYLKSTDEEIEALYGLARAYDSAADNLAGIGDSEKFIIFKKVAIFYYWAAYDCGHPYGMKYAQEIAQKNNIYVDFNDVVSWAQREGIIT